jgi:predicted ATP-binding protein involved in virulence
MKLKTVHIENFRGIKELELTIHPQLTVLIGQNGDGKTTVLDAIAIGLEKLITRLTGERGQPFPNNSIYQTLDPDGKPKQEAYTKITLENEEGIRWDKIKKRQFPRATEPMPASKGDKDLKLFTDRLINAIQAGAEAVNLPVVVYYRTNRAVLDSAQTTPIHSEPSLAMAIENRFAAFRGALAKDISTRFHHAFAWFVNQENEEARLIKAKADLNFKLPVLEAVRYAIEQMLPGCTRPRSTLHPPRFLVDYQDPQTGKTEELSLDQLSDGYRTVLALVIDLVQRMAQANPHLGKMVIQTAPAIVLIDEVDLHLHPIWQQRVLLDLMNTFPKVQFIVTTHSPQVLTSIKAENLRILAREPNQGILAYPPLISPYASESGLVLESVMHVASRPSRLPEVSQLDEYLALVNRGEYNTPTAKDLREKLEKTLANDPALEVANMVIRKYQVLKKTGLKR